MMQIISRVTKIEVAVLPAGCAWPELGCTGRGGARSGASII